MVQVFAAIPNACVVLGLSMSVWQCNVCVVQVGALL